MTEPDQNILYIDDDNVNLLLFEAAFSRYYKVHLAASTKAADILMKEIQFKVVISDISMPNESGLDFIKRFVSKNYEPVFILLTAHINNELLLRAINQGRIFRYLTKPLIIDDVKFTIDQAIELFDLKVKNQELYIQALESHQNFYNVFQASKEGIVIFSSENEILEANAAFLLHFNSNTLPVYGSILCDFLPQELYKDIETIKKQVIEHKSAKVEVEVKFTEQVRIFFEIHGSYIDFKGKLAFICIFNDLTERKLNEKRILNAVVLAEEKERSRLAKDLHDGLGPVLATLKMYLEWLNDQEKVSEHPDILSMALASTEEAISSVKNISNNLSPHILEKFGIVSALNTYIEKLKRVTNISFNVNIVLHERLSLTTEMSVYRIITECITNSLRHADASEILISLNKRNESLYFQYRDNGKGFSVSGTDDKMHGLGISNMKNRVKTLGGKIELKSEPGAGILVLCEVPIN